MCGCVGGIRGLIVCWATTLFATVKSRLRKGGLASNLRFCIVKLFSSFAKIEWIYCALMINFLR